MRMNPIVITRMRRRQSGRAKALAARRAPTMPTKGSRVRSSSTVIAQSSPIAAPIACRPMPTSVPVTPRARKIQRVRREPMRRSATPSSPTAPRTAKTSWNGSQAMTRALSGVHQCPASMVVANPAAHCSWTAVEAGPVAVPVRIARTRMIAASPKLTGVPRTNRTADVWKPASRAAVRDRRDSVDVVPVDVEGVPVPGVSLELMMSLPPCCPACHSSRSWPAGS